MTGLIHSFQSMGAVDGPGLRFVVFMQGCPLRCAFCHNPDTWDIKSGKTYESDDIVKKVLRYRTYFKNGGGVTVSGGEALLQWKFVAELFHKLHCHGIHTALDTSGIGSLHGAAIVLEHTDLVLCDIKFPSHDLYQRLCGGNFNQVKDFLSLTEKRNIPLWVRHVVIPGLTDTEKNLESIRSIAEKYSNLRKIELLPFRKLCLSKYEKLGIDFPLINTPECDQQVVEQLRKQLPEAVR